METDLETGHGITGKHWRIRGELSVSGGLKDGYVGVNVGRGGPPIDRLRTRLAVLENCGSPSQEVMLKSQVAH